MSWYAAAGRTVSFIAATESWSEQSGSEINVIGFPGGDAIAVSIAGQRETTRTFKALLATKTDYDTLRSLRGKAGTLSVDNWDTAAPVSAALKQIAPDPIQVDGEVYVQLQFVLY